MQPNSIKLLKLNSILNIKELLTKNNYYEYVKFTS